MRRKIHSNKTTLHHSLFTSYLRPPLSPSFQPSLGVTGFTDTLTLQQLSEITRTQYQSLKDTFFTEIGQMKHAVDTSTLNVDTASAKQTTEIKQLMSNYCITTALLTKESLYRGIEGFQCSHRTNG